MDAGTVFSLLFTVVVVVVSLLVTAAAMIASLAVPAVIVWFVIKQVQSGKATLVVSGPLAGAMAAAATPAPQGPAFVKRATCPACGGPKVQPSRFAYVYCDFCGSLMDWDFKAALADKRSKQPGPTYEALVRRLQPDLNRAREAGDRRAYEAVQVQIYDAYATHCPAGSRRASAIRPFARASSPGWPGRRPSRTSTRPLRRPAPPRTSP